MGTHTGVGHQGGGADAGTGAPAQEAEPYWTEHRCTGCDAVVHGLHGRWTCAACGACSPYVEPPGGWQADIGYRAKPRPGRKPDYPAA